MKQKHLNLIGKGTIEKIWDRHILDSVQLVEFVPFIPTILVTKQISYILKLSQMTTISASHDKLEDNYRRSIESQIINEDDNDAQDLCQNYTWLDVGSGAGLPGLVVAILFPNFLVYLVESSKKKCKFLTEAVELLGLSNVLIYPQRIEDLVYFWQKKKQIPYFDIISSRAVAKLSTMLEHVHPLIQPSTLCLFPQGESFAMTNELTMQIKKYKLKIDLMPSRTHAASKIAKVYKK